MSYLNDLAERRPDLFTKEEIFRLTKDKRFDADMEELDRQAETAQKAAGPEHPKLPKIKPTFPRPAA